LHIYLSKKFQEKLPLPRIRLFQHHRSDSDPQRDRAAGPSFADFVEKLGRWAGGVNPDVRAV